MTPLELPEAFLAARGASNTAREIAQQPLAWRQTQALVAAERGHIDTFLQPLLGSEGLRVILTGAGTSAYIGQCLAPTLLRQSGRRVEAIATTDLVARPREYLQRDVPTLLVSFARSGGSPESLAAIEFADQCLDRGHHLVITCNAGSELYRRCRGVPGRFALALPEITHDQGFAMTSSFSSMYYAALAIFGGIDPGAGRIESIAGAVRRLIDRLNAPLGLLAEQELARVVFLGSGALGGLAAEAALKLLELSDGAVVTMSNSPLGFRHGPKTIVNRDTMVAVFLANDLQARKYDLDLLEELRREKAAGRLLAIAARAPDAAPGLDCLQAPDMEAASDAELVLPYAVIAQLYAFHRSLRLGLSPDTPCASGRVHRVVRGVTIHPL